MRVGIGYDIHRLAPGRRLVLGGVEIESPVGLEGHSDGDVLLHAVMDAILGAAALEDIGHHFPPSDVRFRDASSLLLLAEVISLVATHGMAVSNVDTVVVAESPVLAPHMPAMRARVAEALRVPPDRVSIKATTNERVGPEGRREAISAHAVVLLEPAR